ncbi:putative WD repeat-containing protein C2E1P5.05 [Hypsizygus marmoreus]|uniref:WD repeat-containing protein C2E1P5.05 n=1 Tax=Hypsizygus marmoreus TaxID=39966 RepID=A0A369K0I3_HYPMA|nr:putative WD repeat-containing protein C2E1P5.05 [Hypsizygus marmoreus]
MPDAFFASSKTRKRKRVNSSSKGEKPRNAAKFSRKGPASRAAASHGPKVNGVQKKKSRAADEELSDRTDEGEGGIDDMDLRGDMDVHEASEDEDEDETPAEKRLRLAKLYLESVKEGLAEGEFDAAEIDKELISARLKLDVLEHSGKVHLFIADAFDFTQPPTSVLRTRGHRFSVTSAVAADSGKCLFTSGKEGTIIKWDLSTGKRLATFHKIRPPSSNGKGKGKAPDLEIHGHTDEVLALALSTDGRHLASAGRDRKLVVWDAEKGEWVKNFGGNLGHKDLISALSFRKGTHQLYTGSFDRTLKVYDLSPTVMGYVETLFGHQDHVLALDSLRGETCVSVGGRDKTVRYWKIVEETQLVFRGGGRSRVREVLEGGLRGDEEGDDMDDELDDGFRDRPKGKETTKKFIEGSLECVAMIDETTFVSGGDSGSICLWTTLKKKPIFTQPLSHGFNEAPSETEGVIRTPRWITALASLQYSDVFVSGSWEGDIRIWKLDSKLKSFALVGTVPAPGVVNSLQLISPPQEFFETSSWITTHENTTNGHPPQADSVPQKSGKGGVRPILLVAGMGQEHRLGRWLNIKDGVTNDRGLEENGLTPLWRLCWPYGAMFLFHLEIVIPSSLLSRLDLGVKSIFPYFTKSEDPKRNMASELVSSPTSPVFRPDDAMPPIFALVIGINHYVSPEYDDLDGAVSDADKFEDFLTDKLNVPPSNIINLRDQDATRSAIIHAFDVLRDDVRIVRDKAAIVIYFAGHGARTDKPTDWSDWETAGDQIEMMCPTDVGVATPEGVIPGIPDRTISVKLNHISDVKGDNVTLILDCCSSGGLNRNATSNTDDLFTGAVPRRIPNPPPIPLGCDSKILSRDSTRGVAVAKGFSGKHNASHVLLAACGREQFAYEHPRTKGGLFTASLLKTLSTSNLDSLTYTSLMDQLNMPIWQTPHCLGQHVNRRLFNKWAVGADGSFILGQKTKLTDAGSRYSIHAGAAQGITAGSIFDVHASNLISDLKQANPSLGTVVVTNVHAFTSDISFPPKSTPFAIPKSFYCKLITRGSEEFPIYSPNRQWLESVFPPQLRNTMSVQIVDTPDAARLHLSLAEQKVSFSRNDPLINPHIGSRFPHTVDEDNIHLVQKVVRCASHFSYHLTRTGEDFKNVWMELKTLKSELSADFDQTLSPIGPNLIENEPATIVVDENARLGMTIYNQTDIPLYPYVFYFDPTDLIILEWYAAPSGAGAGRYTTAVDAPLPSKSTLSIGYGDGGVSPWQFLLRDGEDKDVGFFKLFLATAPTDFSSLEQDSPFEENTTRYGQPAAARVPDAESWGSQLSTVIQVRGSDA